MKLQRIVRCYIINAFIDEKLQGINVIYCPDIHFQPQFMCFHYPFRIVFQHILLLVQSSKAQRFQLFRRIVVVEVINLGARQQLLECQTSIDAECDDIRAIQHIIVLQLSHNLGGTFVLTIKVGK